MIPGAGGDLPELARTRAESLARSVLPCGCAVWAGAEAMHLTGQPGTLASALAGAVLTAVSWGVSVKHDGLGWLPWWAGAGAVLLGTADKLGPLDWWPAPALTGMWVIATLIARRKAHGHDAVTSAREWRDARTGWLDKRHAWHLGGSHLLDYEVTRLGELYTVSTKGTGKRASQLVNSGLAEVIAEAENLPVSRVRLMLHRLAGRIVISVRRADPWARPLLHPLVSEDTGISLPDARSILDEAVIGMDPETGEPLTVPLYDEAGGKNVSVTGIKGAGKGVLLDSLSEHVTACPDALMVRVNLSVKGHAEAASWGPACHLTAFGPAQASRAAAVLRIVGGVIEWRAMTYKRGQYKPSPQDPALVVFGDESDSAAEVPAVRAGINMIATKGREYGVTWVHAGQRGTREYSSSKAKSQDDVYCVGMVRNSREAGYGGGAGLDMASYGEGKPGVWSVTRLGGGTCAGRTWVFHPDAAGHGEEAERIAAERADSQPELPQACQEYLGTAYAALLASEVFPRWAQDRGPAAREDDDGPAAEAPAPPAPTASAVPGTALARTALAEQDFDKWLEMNVDADPDTPARLAGIRAKLGTARQVLEEAAAAPPSGASPEARAAHAAGRWRQVGEQTVIPDEARPVLMSLLGQRTTISAVAAALGVKRWTARTYLERLKAEGIARTEGSGRAARFCLAERSDSQ